MKKNTPHFVLHNCVRADSVADFLDRYYKKDRYYGRGEEYANSLLASHQEYYNEYGFAMISRHDSVTGETVTFVLPAEKEIKNVETPANRR